VAHKHGLAVRIHDRLFIRTEFSALPSDGRRIRGIESDSCERHCIGQERLRSISTITKRVGSGTVHNIRNYHKRQSSSSFTLGLSG
jgi:hypothetical protein